MYDVECKAVAATQTICIVMIYVLFSKLIKCNGSQGRARESSQAVIKGMAWYTVKKNSIAGIDIS